MIDPAATAVDVDSANFDTGTLTVDFLAGGTADDRLAIRHQGTGAGQVGVSGSNVSYEGTVIGTFSGGTNGSTPLVITFDADADQDAVQAVLRNITYANVSDDPSAAARTVRFVLTDGDGGTSNVDTATINLIPVNDAPLLDLDANNSSGQGGADFAATFIEDGGPVAIADADAVLSDVDDTLLQSLTVRITNQLDGNKELLAANTAGTSITASYVWATGTLTLSGADSIAHYQQVLRTITYENTAQNPDTTARLITFVAHDGAAPSNVGTTTVTLVASNDPPVLDLDADNSSGRPGADFATTFTEDGGPVLAADSDATLTDADHTTLQWLTVRITNLLDGAAESLAAVTGGTGIAASYNPGTGTLTLSGADSVANYQQVLRTVAYNNSSQNPNTTNRVLQVVANDGIAASNLGTTTINMVAQNDPPVEATIEPLPLAYTENDGPAAITGTLTLSDVDDTNIETATVRITGNFTPGQDVLAFTNTPNITGSWNPLTRHVDPDRQRHAGQLPGGPAERDLREHQRESQSGRPHRELHRPRRRRRQQHADPADHHVSRASTTPPVEAAIEPAAAGLHGERPGHGDHRRRSRSATWTTRSSSRRHGPDHRQLTRRAGRAGLQQHAQHHRQLERRSPGP